VRAKVTNNVAFDQGGNHALVLQVVDHFFGQAHVAEHRATAMGLQRHHDISRHSTQGGMGRVVVLEGTEHTLVFELLLLLLSLLGAGRTIRFSNASSDREVRLVADLVGVRVETPGFGVTGMRAAEYATAHQRALLATESGWLSMERMQDQPNVSTCKQTTNAQRTTTVIVPSCVRARFTALVRACVWAYA
jgi:hypothetical protein